MRTCPQHYAYSPFVTSILDDVSDYEGNRIGNVFEMPAAHLIAVRVAETEQKAWHDWWTAEMHARATKK